MSRLRTILTATICLGAIPTSAHAHFKLNSPASLSQQDEFGGPQKSSPCGLSDLSETRDDSVPTGAVTILKTGSEIDISITETIFHPGHYRVALAQDIASLPANPPVTGDQSFDCVSTVIDANPMLPILGDGLLQHSSRFTSTQTMKVQLPPGMTCTNCILQVTQFMSDHDLNNPGGCYYHHCATVSITLEGPPPGGDAGAPGDDLAGCCSSHGNGAPALGLAALIGGLLLRRRRR